MSAYQRTKPKPTFDAALRSPRTTFAGLLAGISLLAAGAGGLVDQDPATAADWSLIGAGIASILAGLFARDNATTSERARATPPTLMLLLGMLCLGVLSGAGVGCQSVEPRFVDAAATYHRTAGEEWLGYVRADESLSRDQKADRRAHHEAFGAAIQAAGGTAGVGNGGGD